MNDESIRAIVEEISAQFGPPKILNIDPNWRMMEDARLVLQAKMDKPHCLAPLIDHTALGPAITREDIILLCAEAEKHRFASVCVNPCRVSLAVEELESATPMVCTVRGFPLGANTTGIKAAECMRAVEDGAEELDMVANIGLIKEGIWAAVFADIVGVVERAGPVPVKVILETCLLTGEEIVRACAVSACAGAAYVKTSTGFSSSGATVGAISLMSRVVGGALGVKASGGIGDFETAIAMIKAGATRIGASKSKKIIGA